MKSLSLVALGLLAGLLIGASIAYGTILPSNTNNVVGLSIAFILGLIALAYAILLARKG